MTDTWTGLTPEANATYGDDMVDLHDLIYPVTSEVEWTAAFVQSVTPRPVVLEFGVGTGRLAVPMARIGLSVHGIDLSRRMIEAALRRDDTGTLTVSVDDMTAVHLDRRFGSVLIGLNTLFSVIGQDAQIETLRRAREHLDDDGVLIVEVYDPSIYHSRAEPVSLTYPLPGNRLVHDLTMVDRDRQLVVIERVVVDHATQRTQRMTELSRYAYPAELDLMARVAGLEPRARYADWRGTPADADCRRRIMVYYRIAGPTTQR